ATISVKETDRTGTKAETTASMGGSTATPTDATTTPINTSTPFRVTNLSVSNQSVHVGDEVTVTAWIKNPTGSRLEDDLALATAGEAVETQQVALFASESRAVTFTHTYDAPGEYSIQVANHSTRLRVVEEGAPLTPATTTGGPDAATNNPRTQAANGQSSSGSLSLTDIVLLVVLVGVLAGIGWLLITLRKKI